MIKAKNRIVLLIILLPDFVLKPSELEYFFRTFIRDDEPSPVIANAWNRPGVQSPYCVALSDGKLGTTAFQSQFVNKN
jgi:hypothetical protein